jgi:hypothetical protein
VYRVKTGSGDAITMVYFFLTFETEKDAINYGSSQYAGETATLDARLATEHYNASITYPSMMYDEFSTNAESISDFSFYYNGALLVPANAGADTSVVVGQSTKASSATTTELADRENSYQDMFAAMRHGLVTTYNALTPEERTRSIYDNLVTDMASGSGDRIITPGNKKVFCSGSQAAADAGMAAVVVNGDYTLTGSGDDAYENGYKVHLVIASGDVTVDCNFRGLIIARGTVTLTRRATAVAADASLVQQAFGLSDENDIRPADYLRDGSSYLTMSGQSKSGEDAASGYSSYVTYSNWTRQ